MHKRCFICNLTSLRIALTNLFWTWGFVLWGSINLNNCDNSRTLWNGLEATNRLLCESYKGVGLAKQCWNSDGQAWDTSLCVSCTGLRGCEAGNKPNIITTTCIVAMRGSMLASSIGSKYDWAPYPTPITVGGATERDRPGQKDKCAPVSPASHLCMAIVGGLKRSLRGFT